MSDNLFPGKFHEPLAHRLRPENFEEIIGQKKTISLLKKIKKPLSLILYGPPGTGKTTISKILSRSWNLEFKTLSAISSGVKEIRDLALETEKRGTMVLFLDEIHRFSTSQQDTLLEVVEKGQVILIGATTENPAYRINRPLLSRCQIFKLDALSEGELTELMHRALSKEKLILQFDIESEKYIVNSAGGDGRRLLGILEGLMNVERDSDAITLPIVKNFLDAQVLTYDKNKENHYDFISAFIKSIRGSDPDASVYYLAAMLAGGEDPLFICRRLVILASEDIGNASVYALPLAVSGMTAMEKIGMPEARIILAHITTYLASCPKSNSAYSAIQNAEKFISDNGTNISIPMHLRNPATFLDKKEGAGENYKYPHDYPGSFILESYFPAGIASSSPQFYFPKENGMEKTLKDRLSFLWDGFGKKKYK